MEYDETKLKLALEKILPDKIFAQRSGDGWVFCFRTEESIRHWIEIRFMEWLYICWLAEEKLTDEESRKYVDILWDNFTGVNGYESAFVHASWQQRAKALA